MITETATVVSVEGDSITVSASVKTGCSQCQVSENCGTSAVAKAFTPRQQLLTLRSPMPVRIGDSVVIGIPEQKILLASWLVYIVPLLTLIGGVIALNLYTNWHELVVFSSGLLLAGLSAKGISIFLAGSQSTQMQPVLVSRTTDKSHPV